MGFLKRHTFKLVYNVIYCNFWFINFSKVSVSEYVVKYKNIYERIYFKALAV